MFEPIFPPDRVNYVLRAYLPTWNEAQRLDEIVQFCDLTSTGYVMLFAHAQHVAPNQATMEEVRHECATLHRIRSRFDAESIGLGINASYNMPQARIDRRQRNDFDHWATESDEPLPLQHTLSA